MSYQVIQNFQGGLDTRKFPLSLPPGTLTKCVNAHITQGGEIEKRKMLARSRLKAAALASYLIASVSTDTSATVAGYYKVNCTSPGVTVTGVEYNPTGPVIPSQARFTISSPLPIAAGGYVDVAGFTGGYVGLNGSWQVIATTPTTVTVTYGGGVFVTATGLSCLIAPTGSFIGFTTSQLGKRLLTEDNRHSGIIIALENQLTDSRYGRAVIWSDDTYWDGLSGLSDFTVNIEEAYFGLQDTDAGLLVFGSTATAPDSDLVSYQQLTNPISSSWMMYEVSASCNFGGKAWVVAKFFDQTTASYPDVFDNTSFVFYDGVALGEWWEGYLITSASFLSRMKDIMAAISGFHVESYVASTTATSGLLTIGKTYKITSYVAGDDFTNVGAASNTTGVVFTATGTTPTTWTNASTLVSEGSFNVYSDYGLAFSVIASVVDGTTTGYTAAKVANAIKPTPGYGAAGQFKITGGTGGQNITIASFAPSASPTTITTASAHGLLTGDWVTHTGFNTANNVLNGVFQVTVTGATTYTVAVATGALTTQAATVYKSAGLLRLQVTAGGSTFDLLGTYTGTPLMMAVTTGDYLADITQFSAVVTSLINSSQTAYTAQNDGAQISLFADPSLGALGNNAIISIFGVNNLCTDTSSFQIDLQAAKLVELCGPIRVGTTDILNAATYAGTGSIEGTAKNLASKIEAMRATTGYTAAYLPQMDTTIQPNQLSHNVVVSKLNRNSNDPLPSVFSVEFNGTGVATQGGYAGNNVFPVALNATINFPVFVFQYANAGGQPATVNVTGSGGVPPYSIISVAMDTSGLQGWSFSDKQWHNSVGYNAPANPFTVTAQITSAATILLTFTRGAYYAIRGTLNLTVVVIDSNSPTPSRRTLTGVMSISSSGVPTN